MARIRWSDEEQEGLRREVARLVKEGASGSKLSVVAQAQKVLPKNRRRHIQTTAQIAWLNGSFAGYSAKRGKPPKRASEAPKGNGAVHAPPTRRDELVNAVASFVLDVIRTVQQQMH